MGISFTDDRLVSVSADILNLPAQIETQNQNKDSLNDEKQKIYNKDQDNKLFTDQFIVIVESYHAELKYINSVLRSDYPNSYIDLGARKKKTDKLLLFGKSFHINKLQYLGLPSIQ